MQIMVIEYTRNKLGLRNANSLEMSESTEDPVISLMDGQEGLHSTGGTMRLGLYDAIISKGTNIFKFYKINYKNEERY